MKINSNILLEGRHIVLVPYKEKHVPRYHEWMQSAELLAQTASERLTLKEEYENQQSWFLDDHKCTFIVLERDKWLNPDLSEIDSMVGDVNLFFNDNDDTHAAEIEIMIAEPCARGKGFGKEALSMMMKYGTSKLAVKKYTAKIGCDNIPSLKLFKILGFREVSRSEVFQEVTLELPVAGDAVTAKLLTEDYKTRQYKPDG